MSPAKVLALGFLSIIVLGSFLLYLPVSAEQGKNITLIQAVFTATSAVCVTGLTVIDTATSFSLFGEIVILCMIQLGGLGFMLFATSVLVLARRRISLRNRILLHETMSMPGLSGTVRTTIRFVLIVIAAEFIGASILAVQFIPRYGLLDGIYYGVFHAVSAFCNAGFDLFGASGSLSQFRQSPLTLITFTLLIITGGLGFAVVADLIGNGFNFMKLHLHTKIVVVVTFVLLLFGTAAVAIVEWDNPKTLAFPGASSLDRLINAWFQSVTTRTAGFSSFNQEGMRDASKIISGLLMFIGASPASTGGGVKTTTLFVLFVLIRSVFYGRSDVEAFHRRLPLALIRTALSIFLISICLLIAGAVFMSLFEEQQRFNLVDLLFEEISALATVGLTTAGTGNFSSETHIWLILLMYLGRVGPLTMMLSFSRRYSSQRQGVRYPEEHIYVG